MILRVQAKKRKHGKINSADEVFTRNRVVKAFDFSHFSAEFYCDLKVYETTFTTFPSRDNMRSSSLRFDFSWRTETVDESSCEATEGIEEGEIHQ